LELLQEADVVAYGDLVPEDIVALAKGAARVRIGQRREEHERAVEALIEEAREKKVVVLKNGDPTIFGRGLEICRKAEERGVPCEVVPGVSSFTAAAALHRIELTDGKELRHVALLAYPHFGPDVVSNIRADTLVIFMMGNKLVEVANALRETCPSGEVYICINVSRGGSCRRATIEELPSYAGQRPALIIVRRCWRPDPAE
jgi:uroporphyrin-III C-methyltransferase